MKNYEINDQQKLKIWGCWDLNPDLQVTSLFFKIPDLYHCNKLNLFKKHSYIWSLPRCQVTLQPLLILSDDSHSSLSQKYLVSSLNI